MGWIRRTYRVPAKRGARVIVDGLPGVITAARNGYILVRFTNMKRSVPCHPTWRVVYTK